MCPPRKPNALPTVIGSPRKTPLAPLIVADSIDHPLRDREALVKKASTDSGVAPRERMRTNHKLTRFKTAISGAGGFMPLFLRAARHGGSAPRP